MVICAQCGEHNAEGARFCSSCSAFLEWEGAPDEQPVATTVASGAEGAPGSVAQPSEQVLQPPRHPMSTSTAQRRPPAPGDLICPNCGEGNASTRQFCRRCAASLAESVPVRLPWWRRWLGWLRRQRHHAADRHGHTERRSRHNRFGRNVRRTLRWTRNILAVLVVLGGILYGAYPPFRHSVNSDVLGIKNDTIGKLEIKYTPVHADKVVANFADPGHPADAVNDNNTTTYWEAPTTKTLEPTLTLSFDHSANLAQAIIHSGIGSDFQSADRPKTLHLVYSTGHTADVNLADTPDPQQVALSNGSGATSVEVFVTAVYQSLQSSDVAITEIELFEKD